MMKQLLFLLLTQGILMSATLTQLDLNRTSVPLIFEEDNNLPIVSMQLIFQNSGSLTDPKDGLVKLSAKLLNEGTKKEGSVGFATKLENRAISLSTHVGKETLVIELSSLKSEFAYGLNLLEELLKDPNYTEETLQKIKTQTIGTIKRKESDFDYLSNLTLRGMLFPKTPLAKPALGTVESVKGITLEDIQGQIQDHLGLENLIVVMGGDLNQSEAKEMVMGLLHTLPHVQSKAIPTMQAQSKPSIKKTTVESKQAYIYFGAPLDVAYDAKNRYMARVASFILGSSGFGSRLMEEIRVKQGLAYSAYSRFKINKTHTYFSGYLQTKVASGEEAVKRVGEVVKQFIQGGVTQEELTAAQQFLLGSEPLRNETLSQRLNRAFQEYYRNQPLGSSLEDLKKIETLSLKELNAFIHEHQEIGQLSFSVVTGKEKVVK